MARHHVADGGARQADGIDAEMRTEAAVFNRYESVWDIHRQFRHRHHLTLGQAAPRHQAAAIV